MTQGINKQIGSFSTVKPKRHFLKVRGKMLCAYVMPCSAHASLEQGESIFDGVGVSIAHDIDSLTVSDGLMPRSRYVRPFHCIGIRSEIIGKDHLYILADVLFNETSNRCGLHVFGMEQTKLSVALANPDDDFFIGAASTEAALVLPTDIGFVHLKFSVQHRLICLCHGCPDAVAKIPSRLIANTERALNLAGGHSFFSFAQQMCSQEPLRQRQMRIVKNCSRRYAKLVAAIRAFKLTLCKEARYCAALATRACDTFRPAQTSQQFPAFFIGREAIV